VIFAVTESLDYKIVVAVLAIVLVALKIVLDVLKWRKESAQPQQEVNLQQKILDGIEKIHLILDRENLLTGQRLIYVPRDLESKLEMLREIRAQTGEILRQMEEISSRSGVWNGPSNPGG
jgi:hypothetical protein